MPYGGRRTSPRTLPLFRLYFVSFGIIGPIVVSLKMEFCSCIRKRASAVLQTSLLLMTSLDKTDTPIFSFIYTAFNTRSVISRRCLDVAGRSMLTFRVPTEISRPIHLIWYSSQSHHTVTDVLIPSSTFLMLTAKEQLVSFIKSLVWLDRGSNQQTHGHKVDALSSRIHTYIILTTLNPTFI